MARLQDSSTRIVTSDRLVKKFLNIDFVRNLLLGKINWIYLFDYTLVKKLLGVIYVVNDNPVLRNVVKWSDTL